MKHILKKITNFFRVIILILISFFVHFFFSSKKEKEKNLETKERQKETKNFSAAKASNVPTTPETITKENQSIKFTISKEELSQELKKILKENKIELLKKLEQQEKEVKDWYDKTLKKAEKLFKEEKLIDLESVQEHFKKELKKFTEQHKMTNSKEFFEQEKLQEEILKNPISYHEANPEPNHTTVLNTQRLDSISVKPQAFFTQEENLPRMIYETKKIEIEQRKKTLPSTQEKKEIPNPVLEEKKPIEETLVEVALKEPLEKEEPQEKKKLQTEEKRKELKNIDIAKMEKETDKLISKSEKVLEKGNILSREYEEILKEIEKKEQELTELLQNPLKENQKIKVKAELQKITKMKNILVSKKDRELESIRISLEESISLEEKDRILEECMKWNRETTEEIQEKLIIDIEKKTQLEIRKLEQEFMKRQLRRISNVLSFPMALSLPFIKNKYYRMLVSGFFIFQGLNWIQSLLFRSPNTEFLPDLTVIRTGRDALEESMYSLVRNQEMFKHIKTEMLEKYPELIQDKEFLSLINSIEYNLEIEYQKYTEKTQTINRYFKKGKKLERKLKRRWI